MISDDETVSSSTDDLCPPDYKRMRRMVEVKQGILSENFTEILRFLSALAPGKYERCFPIISSK